MNQEVENKKFYEKKWFAFVMLVLLAPVGIYFLWRYNHFTKIPRILLTGLFSILFLIVLFSEGETDANISERDDSEEQEVETVSVSENEEDELEEIEEEIEEVKKEMLYMDLLAASYDEETDKITLEAETNFADGIEVSVGFYEVGEEYLLPMIVSSGEISDGNLVIDISHTEEDSMLNFIVNGNYSMKASLSSHDHAALVDVYESYDAFVESYELKDGTVEKTDDGFKIEGIQLGEIEISNAHTEEAYNRFLFEQDKDLYEALDYAQLNKNPNGHAGEFVYYTGEIIQIMEDLDFTIIRLAVTEDAYGYNFNDVVWVEYDSNTEFIDGDIITVYGMIVGSHSYTSQAGWEITVPAILADWIE